MTPATKEILTNALGLFYLLVLALGPPAFLLWTWRRWALRGHLAVHAVLLPVAVFVVAGTVGAAGALFEVATSGSGRAGSWGRSGPAGYVARNFWDVGRFSLWIATLFALGWWVPALAIWRRAHPASFDRVARVGPGGPPSPEEQDYGDPAVVEPGGAPGRRRSFGA